jgi:hypothetical protein
VLSVTATNLTAGEAAACCLLAGMADALIDHGEPTARPAGDASAAYAVPPLVAVEAYARATLEPHLSRRFGRVPPGLLEAAGRAFGELLGEIRSHGFQVDTPSAEVRP